MNIVIIQPNWQATSEVWMMRMQEYMEKEITGIAAFFPTEDKISTTFNTFNLNGRKPNYFERNLIRFKIKEYNRYATMEKELLQFIKSNNADILFVHFLSTAEYLSAVLKKINIPIIIHVHGIDILWQATDFFSPTKLYHHSNYKSNCTSLIRLPNIHLIANSKFSIGQLQLANIDLQKVTLKYFGVPEIKMVRDYFKTNLTVLFLGRLVEYKGPDLVIESFIKACDKGFKGDLVIAGEGPMKPFCELIVARSFYKNRIKFLGKVTSEQAATLYREADVYTMHNCKGALTNEVEAFGVSIIEAMSYYLPIITGATGGVCEIIENGEDGILVPSGDTDSHADSFMKLFNNRDFAKLLGQNAAKKITNKFSIKNEKDVLFSVLDSVKNINKN
jgi:glycosyltransferase involved in cell wall biosynthesis